MPFSNENMKKTVIISHKSKNYSLWTWNFCVLRVCLSSMLQRKKTEAVIFIKEAWEVWDECEPTIWKFPNKAAQRKIRKVANEEPPPNIVQLLPHWVKLCFKRDNRSNMYWALYGGGTFYLPTERYPLTNISKKPGQLFR